MGLPGTAIKQNFSVITGDSSPAPIYTPILLINECCFSLPALAESAFTRDEYNDYHGPIFFFGNKYTTAVLKLQQYTNGAWADIANLDDNTYGTFYDWGFYYTIYNENAIGYLIDWSLVLSNYDEGSYRVKCTSTDIFGNNNSTYSLDFCLLEYSEERANNTVRIDWWMNGNVGDKDFDTKRRDYGDTNWANSIRLPNSMFGFDEPNVTRSFVKYQTGAQIWTADDEFDSYTLKTGMLTNLIRRYLRFDTFKGSEMRITDYNISNPNEHINRYVVLSGAAKINYFDNITKAPMEVKFDQYFQNNSKKRC